MRRFKGDYLGNRNLKMSKWIKNVKDKIINFKNVCKRTKI